jgi:extracellular elastinolytic metalloproteinase
VGGSVVRRALVVAAASVLAMPAAASAVVDLGDGGQALPDVDTRAAVEPTAAQRDAARATGAQVEWGRYGTPSSVFRAAGPVAQGVAGADATAAARAWLQDNETLFRLASLDDLDVVSAGPLSGSATSYAVVMRQRLGGLATSDGVVTVALRKGDDGWDVTYASSSLTAADDLTGTADLTPEQGFAAAARQSGAQQVSAGDVSVQGRSAGWTQLGVRGLHGHQAVRKVAFPTPHHGARVAYEAAVTDSATQAYRTIVDAETGDLLLRESATDNLADDPTWRAFPAWPVNSGLNAYPWNYSTADVRELWCWTSLRGCRVTVADSASRVPWDVDAASGQPTFQTTGNNADAIERWVNSGPRIYAVGHHAVSPSRDYQYPWTNVWFNSRCNPANLTGSGNDIDAAITNLFAMHNRMHDFAYHLGWDEQHWNAQNFNYGMGTADHDAVLGNAQSAAISGGYPNYGGRDNANMNTPSDGTSPVTNMFLWQPLPGAFYAPCVDGDYDMSVIGHEYGHAIENRMIGKGNRRQGMHAGAMGEAFGDFDAIEYLNEAGLVPRYAEQSPFVEGAYATGNPFRGIRDYDMSWPMGGDFPTPGDDPAVNPLNFGDFGFDTPGPEVHADGEIWIATQFDIRDLFLSRYRGNAQLDAACLHGQRPAEACPGDRRWIQDYYDAMVLMPAAPTMVDARNAELAADMARFGGANQDLLWRGFARRGYGQLASAASANDTDPVPDFSSPAETNATLVFSAVSKDGSAVPVKANVYVGDYEARVTPIADTDPATSGPNLDDTVAIAPTDGGRYRAYDFVASAPGYGHVRFKVQGLNAGDVRHITIRFPTNWASQSQGASASGDGQFQGDLIDDTENTNWGETGAPVQGQQVVVKLGGGGPVRFSSVNVSALITGFATHAGAVPAENRFTALRAFDLYACTAGANRANPTCDGVASKGWKRILRSQNDAFPAVNPRPVAPDLILRNWSVPTTTATHVRFVVRDNQCTGQRSFQGDQDNDPQNNSDCRVGDPGTPYPARNTEVHAAELQVWSSKPAVDGAVVAR